MARSDPQLNFRIPADLKEQLELAAKENNRSLTAELINRLDESINGTSYDSNKDIHAKLDNIYIEILKQRYAIK